MKVTLCIPTIRRFDLLHECIIAALNNTRPPDKISIIDNSGGLFTVDGWRTMIEQASDKIIDVITPNHNKGVAGSWNTFLHTYEDMMLISNDDVIFDPYLIEEMIKAWNTNPECMFFYPAASNASMFAVYAMRKNLFTTVGNFDENFYPAYFEDNDYNYRMRIYGYTEKCVESAHYTHKGSATIKSYSDKEMNKHHKTFQQLARYYKEKWGGLPNEEIYTEPFVGCK